jgi:uncharacterized cupin superfamily protein
LPPMHPNLVHIDDVETVVIDRGPLQGRRAQLGAAAGMYRTGLSRYVLGPGERAMPVHVHADEEEIFHVLAGSGFSWQDGKAYAVGENDTIAHLRRAEAHTIVAGDEGLDVLAFGSGSDTGMTWLPRAKSWWMGPHWLPEDAGNPFQREADAGPLELPEPQGQRPTTIRSLHEVDEEVFDRPPYRERSRRLGAACGSVAAGLNRGELAPGAKSCPLHWHSAEEECFVILGGEGEMQLGDERFDVRRGTVVARPPDTGVGHALHAGESGLTYLVYGTRLPCDYCYYPDSKKLGFGGGALFRIEPLDYWDGE